MWFVRSAFALVALASLFVAPAPASAQEAADCLACHGDRESLSSLPEATNRRIPSSICRQIGEAAEGSMSREWCII